MIPSQQCLESESRRSVQEGSELDVLERSWLGK
jgi:hypothetical protein